MSVTDLFSLFDWMTFDKMPTLNLHVSWTSHDKPHPNKHRTFHYGLSLLCFKFCRMREWLFHYSYQMCCQESNQKSVINKFTRTETALMLALSTRLGGFSGFMSCKKLFSFFYISTDRSIRKSQKHWGRVSTKPGERGVLCIKLFLTCSHTWLES